MSKDFSTKPILIIKVGYSFESLRSNPSIGDFEDMIKKISSISLPDHKFSFEVINVTINEPLPKNISNYLAIFIHGSHEMVTDLPSWSETTKKWLQDVVFPSGKPLLGICYGHQLICQSLGGKVDYNPNGKESGGVEVEFGNECSKDKIFKDLANSKHIMPLSHSQSIIEPPKCEDFLRLGKSECEAFQAVHFTGNCWGFQFHPEFCIETIRTYDKYYYENHLNKLAKNYVKDSYKSIDENFNKNLIKKFLLYSLSLLN